MWSLARATIFALSVMVLMITGAFVSDSSAGAAKRQTTTQRTPESCRAALRQHVTVPEYKPFSKVATDGTTVSIQLPSRLLFSANGVEGYADTLPDSTGSFNYGVRVLIVYQSEAARQEMIKRLRGGHVLPASGLGASVENLKFSAVTFAKPLGTPWRIAHIGYYQPLRCINVFQEDIQPAGPAFPDSYIGHGNAILDTGLMEDGPEVDGDSSWFKTLQAMLAWVKESSARIEAVSKEQLK
jgi:hypothetical protein